MFHPTGGAGRSEKRDKFVKAVSVFVAKTKNLQPGKLQV
jgi:hypothetical protein